MVNFEGKEKREASINECLKKYGIKDLEEARQICLDAGIDVEAIVKGIQPICFENAVWAYTLGTALAIKQNVPTAEEAGKWIGIGLQAFCVPVQLLTTEKLVSVTETLHQCF